MAGTSPTGCVTENEKKIVVLLFHVLVNKRLIIVQLDLEIFFMKGLFQNWLCMFMSRPFFASILGISEVGGTGAFISATQQFDEHSS